MDPQRENGYILDNRQSQAGVRFAALAELFDASTFRHLDALGLGDGWRCWEVGAGGRGVPDGLAERVGPGGSVLATDIDVSWLGPDEKPDEMPGSGTDGVPGEGTDGVPGEKRDYGPAPLQVLRHDVGAEPAPAADLDLVHARLVLTHVPRREAALTSVAAALRPGGWLVLEEADPGLQPLLCPDEHGPEQELANRLRHGFRTLMAERDADLAYGRTLPRRLRELGLVDVGADAYFPITGPACTTLEIATVEQIRDRLVDAGAATAADVDEHLDNVRAGPVPDLATSPMVTAWARRP